MSFDLSRISFDARKNFLGVVMQQGRVQLDADWNEWVAQLARRIQAGTLDALGQAAVPRETPDGFRIEISENTLLIRPGRIYVDGILVENHGGFPDAWNPSLAERASTAPVTYLAQPYLPNPPDLPKTPGPHLVYLDVWQRDVIHLQDPALIEKAVGVDSTGRLQTVWQVKVLENVGDITCAAPSEALPGWLTTTRPSAGRMSTAIGDQRENTSNPCEIRPGAGYSGLENQLYRVEIHQGGGLGTATFKWSRDNATVVARVTHINPARNRITVDSMGRDDLLRFNNGDWVEVTDDYCELNRGFFRFENEFGVYNHGEPPGRWAISSGNSVIQTELVAGSVPTESNLADLGTTVIHRYRLKGDAAYVAMTVHVELMLNAVGYGNYHETTGLVFNWKSERDFWLLFVRMRYALQSRAGNFTEFSFEAVHIIDSQAAEESRISRTEQVNSMVDRINLEIRRIDARLQFIATVSVSDYNESYTLEAPAEEILIPGSQLGLFTRNIGTARFTRLQVQYGNESSFALIPVAFRDNQIGELRRIQRVDDATRTIDLETALPDSVFPVVDENGTVDPDRHLLIRRWDQSGQVPREDGNDYCDLEAAASTGEIPVPPAGARLFLEHGILVEFHLDVDGGEFKSGDYWVFAARSLDASIELLNRAPPLGIHHHYAPLAIVRRPDEVIDLRTLFNPAIGSVQVCSVLQVDANSRDRPLRPGMEVPANLLADGLKVLIRQSVDPNSVNDGSLFVSTEIPYRLQPPYAEEPNGAVVAYQPVVLPAEVALVDNGVLNWRPFGQTLTFLSNILQHDVPRLGNVRFEREFEVFDHGGPPSNWMLTQGNVVIQTQPSAGTAPNPQTSTFPTMAVHRYRMKDGVGYVGLTVEESLSRSVGLVYNWLTPKDFSLFVGSEVWVPYGYSGAYATLVMSHVQIKDGQIVVESQKNQTVSGGFGDPRRIALDIKQLAGRLQFGCNALGGGGNSVSVQELDFPRVDQLIPGSRLGALTAGTGTAQFTRLQVVYGNDSPVTLIPAGLTSRLLSRLVLKRSLLEVVSGTGGTSLGGGFADPIPEPDFETWFWLTPPTPGYYDYPYGGSPGYRGIGSGRLVSAGSQ